ESQKESTVKRLESSIQRRPVQSGADSQREGKGSPQQVLLSTAAPDKDLIFHRFQFPRGCCWVVPPQALNGTREHDSFCLPQLQIDAPKATQEFFGTVYERVLEAHVQLKHLIPAPLPSVGDIHDCLNLVALYGESG